MPSRNASSRQRAARSALPIRLEELRLTLLATIDEFSQETAVSYGTGEGPVKPDYLPVDASHTLAIMGERGSGKSTLLAATCRRLVDDRRHIVLPMIRPELFSETDTVITVFLAELWELLAEPTPQSPLSPDDYAHSAETLRALSAASEAFAISRTRMATLEQASDSPMTFADEVLTVTRSGVTLLKTLRQLARVLCLGDGSQPPRLVVAPIDDPDLSRRGVTEILADLQMLGSIPGLVPITGFSRTDISDYWLAERRSQLPHVTEEHLFFGLSRQLDKIFPYRCRFEIEPVPEDARWAFAPLGQAATLGERLSALCEAVSVTTESSWSLADTLASSVDDSSLPSALPDNPRTLVQLWDVLAPAAGSEAVSAHLYLTLRRVVDILAEPLAVRLSMTTRDLAVFGLSPGADKLRTLSLANSELQLSIAARGDYHASRQDGAVASIELRRLARVRVTRPRSTPQAQAEELAPREIACLLTLQDIAYGSGLFEVTSAPDQITFGDWQFLQRVTMTGQSTDNLFLTLPAATTFTEVRWAERQWNTMVDIAPELNTVQVLARSLRVACAGVTGEEVDASGSDDYELAFAEACRLFQRRRHTNHRADAFREWFEFLLPMHWHTGFFSAEKVRTFASRHAKVCDGRAPSALESSTNRLRELFDVRLRNILDEIESEATSAARAEARAKYAWVAGYFALASERRSPHVDALSRLFGHWQRANVGARVGAAATGHLSRPSSRRKMAPYATPEGTELLAAGVAALHRAVAAAKRTSQSRT